jgi:hypothetical protein
MKKIFMFFAFFLIGIATYSLASFISNERITILYEYINRGKIYGSIQILRIDGCEYITMGHSEGVSITHKANCPNHKK